MQLKSKGTLPFLTLFSILFLSLSAPLLVSANEFDSSGVHKTGKMVNINYPEGNLSYPETKNELYFRGESRFLPNLGTGFLSAPLRCVPLLLPLGRLVFSIIHHFEFNPVKIAQFYHLGDGMK